MHFHLHLVFGKVAFDDLNLGCGRLGVDESQGVAAHPHLVLQDESALRGGGDLPRRQAAAGRRDRDDRRIKKHRDVWRETRLLLTRRR